MNCVSKEEIRRWSINNEESFFFLPVPFNHTLRKHYQWYEREPRLWFKPIFSLLLVFREYANNRSDLFDELVNNTLI